MNDFENRLSALLDDVASSVHPRLDHDALFVPTVKPMPHNVHRFGPRFVAFAAAGIVLLGGTAFAMERVTSDPPKRVTSADTPATKPTDAPTTTTTKPIEPVITTVPVKPTEPVITTVPVKPVTIETVVTTLPDKPVTKPPVAPVVIEFLAKLGADGQANAPMTQGFFGTAMPGSAIRIASEWGVAETSAAPNGKWDATLVMLEVPPGTTVGVRITSSTSERVREFVLVRPGIATPIPIDFTANAALTTTNATPAVNEYWGTSTAGAVISITSPYANLQVESSAAGKWSARLEFPDAPVGVAFNVHITSSKGEASYDFSLIRLATI